MFKFLILGCGNGKCHFLFLVVVKILFDLHLKYSSCGLDVLFELIKVYTVDRERKLITKQVHPKCCINRLIFLIFHLQVNFYGNYYEVLQCPMHFSYRLFVELDHCHARFRITVKERFDTFHFLRLLLYVKLMCKLGNARVLVHFHIPFLHCP